MNIISVVLGADTKKFRGEDSTKIIEYSYNTYKLVNLKEIIEKEFEGWLQNYIPEISKGKKQNLQLKLRRNFI